MAAPSFGTAGAGATGTTSVNVPYPASISAGDLLLMHVMTESGLSPTASGWYQISEVIDAGNDMYFNAFAKSATGSESGSFTVGSTDASTTIKGRMYRYINWLNDATMANNFESVVSNGVTTNATITDAGVTTLGPDRMAINLVGVEDDNTFTAFTGMSGGTWSMPVTVYTNTTLTDMALGIDEATIASAGTIDGGSVTMAASDPWVVIGFAIIGTTASFTPRSPAVNYTTTAVLNKAHQAARRFRRGRHGILVPDYPGLTAVL